MSRPFVYIKLVETCGSQAILDLVFSSITFPPNHVHRSGEQKRPEPDLP